jgi:aminopeptidase N
MKQPHPCFSTALAIGKYKWRERTAGNGTPLEQWYYPDLPDRVDATYRLSEQMFPFLEDALGTPYPWPVYREAPLTDYPYGAMETTTATVFNDRYLVNYSTCDSNAYVNVNCHELAHQWLGNYISHLNPRDVWITESTATYFAKLFERRVFGEDRYQDERLDEMLTAVKNPPSDDFPVAHSRGGVSRWYDKGSLVLDLLRETIGDSAFRLGMRTYFQQFGDNLATSSDLTGCFEKASGRNLKTFTDQWLYRAGEPVIETSRIRTPRGMFAIIRQTQSVDDLHPVFKIETTIEIRLKNGEVKRIAARLQSPADTIPLKGCKEEDIVYILTDPDRFIPSVQKYSRTSAEAFAVLMNSPSVIARYEAMVEWLGSNEVTAGQLLQAWDKENHVRTRIRNGILKGMSRHQSPAISKAIAEACFHSDEPVRRAAAVVFDTIPPAFRKTFEKMLYDRSPMVATLAFDRLCFSFPESFARYSKLVKPRLLQTDFRGRIIWLGHALRNEYCRAYFDELTAYTTPRYNLRTSRHAAEVLKSLK